MAPAAAAGNAPSRVPLGRHGRNSARPPSPWLAGASRCHDRRAPGGQPAQRTAGSPWPARAWRRGRLGPAFCSAVRATRWGPKIPRAAVAPRARPPLPGPRDSQNHGSRVFLVPTPPLPRAALPRAARLRVARLRAARSQAQLFRPTRSRSARSQAALPRSARPQAARPQAARSKGPGPRTPLGRTALPRAPPRLAASRRV